MPQPIPQGNEFEEIEGVWGQIKPALDYLVSPELQQILLPLKIAFIAVSVVLLGLIIYFISHSEYFQELFLNDTKNFLFPKLIKKKIASSRWKKIRRILDKAKYDSQWKVALVEAFELMEHTMKRIGYTGEKLTDKINKIIKDDAPNVEDAIRAAQLCQDVIKDPDFKIKKGQIKEVIEDFEKLLKSLELL